MFASVVLLILSFFDVVFFFIPSPVDPILNSTFEKKTPKFEGALKVNSMLTKTERLFEGKVFGPESMAFDSKGILYTGLGDGRIVKLEEDKVKEINRTGKQVAECGTVEFWSKCGRPLGMRFDRNGINLIVADAYFGLLEVNPETKVVKTLLPPAPGFNGKPFRFVNHLDIDEDGTIFFTDSSAKWQAHQASYSFFEGDKTGRLMAYHLKTGELELLMDGLYFANGVQISPEGDHLLVVEYAASRIMKYYIKGENKGKSEVFVENLPGYPDNIRPSSSGGYWVAMSMVFTEFNDMLMYSYPRARNFLAKVFYLPWLVNFAGPNYGLILELDRNGHITRSFQDPTGSVVPGHISEVYDDGNVLYLGSYQSSFLGKLELKD